MVSIPGYQVDEPLYESVHSLIYRARREVDEVPFDCAQDRPVVLKILKGDYPPPEELARFRREYAMTRSLADVDGVIRTYGLEPYHQTLCMVLEDFGGESLARLLPERSLTTQEFLRLAIRIPEIVGRVHHRHIMHKDINPSNIVWNPTTDQVKIIDFGISTELSREHPAVRNPERLEGTLAYISPEQTGRMNRAMDYRTDLYSLGATLYHLLTGQVPFQTTDALELVHCHLAKMPVPPCDLVGAHRDAPSDRAVHEPPLHIISDIILKLLAKNPEDRYHSAYGLKYDLEECTARVSLANPPPLPPRKGSQTETCAVHFELGQHDISERFQIPQKLYGREQEIATLLTAFDRTVSQQSPSSQHTPVLSEAEGSQILLVTGYAGIGKTALVNEIQTPIVAKRGSFLSGKFDQLNRNSPYSAFIQAFQGFVRQLLSESEERISLWKEQFLKAVGPNGQVLIDIIPKIELMLGEQPPVHELPPNQAQNRFNRALYNRTLELFG